MAGPSRQHTLFILRSTSHTRSLGIALQPRDSLGELSPISQFQLRRGMARARDRIKIEKFLNLHSELNQAKVCPLPLPGRELGALELSLRSAQRARKVPSHDEMLAFKARPVEFAVMFRSSRVAPAARILGRQHGTVCSPSWRPV